MSTVWVAYDHTGDLIACADTEDELWRQLDEAGWFEDEVYVGRATA